MALTQERTKAVSRSRAVAGATCSVRGADEQQLAVGEHEHAVGVALGLTDVVGRVDHRGPSAARR